MQSAHAKHIDKGVHKTNQIGSKKQGAAVSGGHNHQVTQRAADGCLAIVGPGGEKEALSDGQEDKAIHLDEAIQV